MSVCDRVFVYSPIDGFDLLLIPSLRLRDIVKSHLNLEFFLLLYCTEMKASSPPTLSSWFERELSRVLKFDGTKEISE